MKRKRNIAEACMPWLFLLITLTAPSIILAQVDVKHFIPALFGRENQGDHYLTLSTEHPTPFTVQVKDGSGALLHNVTISDNYSQTIYLGSDINSPVLVRETELNTPLNDKGLIVEGDFPFSTTLRIKADEQAASLVSKGNRAAGQDFRLLFPQNNAGFSHGKTNVFGIMATADNTLIQLSDFQPGVVLFGTAASGTPLTSTTQNIQLDAGETIVFAAYLDGPQNTSVNGMDGLAISSNQPIVVNSGSWIGGNAQTGLATGISASGRDIGIDQLLPLSELGQEYLAVKGNGIESEFVKVAAAYDQTTIQVNGTSNYSLNAGETLLLPHTAFDANGVIHLLSNKSIYVGQMLNASNGLTDDIERQFDFVSLPPLHCHGSKKLKIPLAEELGTAQLKVIAETGADVYFEGNLLNNGINMGNSSGRTLYTVNSNIVGDVRLESTGLLQVYHFNLNGHQGAVAHYAGFAKELFMTAQFHKEIDPAIHLLPEGCGAVDLSISRSSNEITTIDTIYFSTSGTAAEGTDYSNVPDFLIFQAGDTILQFSIDIFSDALSEATETVTIQLEDEGLICGAETVSLKIRNIEELNAAINHQSAECPVDTIATNVTISGGASPYQIDWSYGDSTQQSNYITSGVDVISIQVTDFCEVEAYDTISLGVDPYALNILSSPDILNDCPYSTTDLFSEVTGGIGNYFFQWYNNGQAIDNGSMIQVAPGTTTSYTVLATDQCGVSAYDTVEVTVATELIALTASNDTIVCPYDSVDLAVNVLGGKPPYVYNWNNGTGMDSTLIVQPEKSSSFTIEVYDQCATYIESATILVEVQRPEANFHVLSNQQMVNLPISLQNTSSNAFYWQWDLGNGSASSDHSPKTLYNNSGWHQITLIAEDHLGCRDTVIKPIYIEPEFYFYAPNSFTPNGDGLNSSYEVSVIGAKHFQFMIFDRWGKLVLTTDDPFFGWDGTLNYEDAADGVYVYKCLIETEGGKHKEFTGHITLIR